MSLLPKPLPQEFVKAIEESEESVKTWRDLCFELLKEIKRLKEGNFTEEEFQNLCHNTDVQNGYNRFVQGCNEYQKKLFGRCQNEDEEKRVVAIKTLAKIESLNDQFALLRDLK